MSDNPRQILVADDNEMNRTLLRHILETEGEDLVIEAENGQQALALLRDRPFDLLLLDVRMPVMDGEATLIELKQDPLLNQLPVLLISGSNDDMTRRCMTLGANAFATKPYDIEKLRVQVKTLTSG